MSNSLPPSGTRDFSSEDIELREYIFEKTRILCELRGFHRIDTPAMENIETIAGKYGEESEKLIFKILKRGEKEHTGEADMALRYDLTVPSMRYFSKNQSSLPRVFKRYQFGPVWRADRPGKGRYREFFQFDFDIYGSSSILADLECLQIMIDSLVSIGIEEFTVNLNSRQLISALMTSYGVPANRQPHVLRIIDKLDKIGIDGVISEIAGLDVEDSIRSELINDLRDTDFVDIVRSRVSNSEEGIAGLSDIDSLMEFASRASSNCKIEFNPLMVRGIDYYTGPIYEVTAPNAKWSIASGGRYDSLSRLFLKNDVPVCGSSLGIDRILLLLKNQNVEPRTPKVYAGTWSDSKDSISNAVLVANKLRENGISTEIDLLGGRLGKQIGYADKLGCQYFVFQGPDEFKRQTYSIKNLVDGSQCELVLEELINFVK